MIDSTAENEQPVVEQSTQHFDLPHDDPEDIAAAYCRNLGFTWEELQGKTVLDVGAGQAPFARAAKERGVTVTSMDIAPGGWGHEEEGMPKDVPYLVEDFRAGTSLPAESFDLIVGKASIGGMAETAEDFAAVIAEAKRLLKPGGEFRFDSDVRIAPLTEAEEPQFEHLLTKVIKQEPLDPEEQVFKDRIWPKYEEHLAREKELKSLPEEKRAEKDIEYRFADMKAVEPSLTRHDDPIVVDFKGKKIQGQSHYFSYKKPSPVIPQAA